MAVDEPYGVTEMFVKGEPYGQVKKRARYMLSGSPPMSDPKNLFAVIEKLIEYAPQQTLAALCEVLDPDRS